MKSNIILVFAALIAVIQAYELRIFFLDGMEARVTGDQGSPCQDLPKQVHDTKVNKITFDPGAGTREFYVWSKINCAGELVKNRGAGTHEVDPPMNVGSIKIM